MRTTVHGGIPATNNMLVWRLGFNVGDPVALVVFPNESVLIVRDIEMERARKHARADRVACPADFEPQNGTGLSPDRELTTAQAAAECLRRANTNLVYGDRSLPLIFAETIRAAGVDVALDPDWGIRERRQKSKREIEALRSAQSVTEGAMRMACELVAKSSASADGVLTHGGEVLTSERVRAAIDTWLLERGFTNPGAIVAGGPVGADCHDRGHGALRTGEPVIIDIFPRDRASGYNGDCTRTVVHGEISTELAAMHTAVLHAKAAATAATKVGATGDAVHQATVAGLAEHGFAERRGGAAPADAAALIHGTGHGIGLDVHEPILLDHGNRELLLGEAFTIEPGLYKTGLGGIRVEDMVIVTAEGCDNLNQLPEHLNWA